MGICSSCCKSSNSDSSPLNSIDQDELRRKMAEAAEKRQREEERRGLKDGSVGARRIAEAREKSQKVEEWDDTRNSDAVLRWQAN